jgi:AcrR family transcriptional regulator
MGGRTQEQRRADTRARLLAAAADLFARKGFHAVSADAVAGAADRTTGALYDHFGGKEGLLLALVEAWMEQTIADLRPALDQLPALDDRLAGVWRGVARNGDDNADAWLLLEFELWLHGVRDPQIGTAVAARFDTARRGMAEALERWGDEFGFELPGDPIDTAAQVVALVVGAAFQVRLDPSCMPEAVVIIGLRRLLGIADRADAVLTTDPTSADKEQHD